MLITVRVHPRAAHAKTAWKDGVLEVWVTAPPVEGAANQAVLEAIATHFGVRASAVRLRSGSHGRKKLVEIEEMREGGGR